VITRRERKGVYGNDAGWTCLNQEQPRRFVFTLIACVHGPHAIPYRVA
jgi:hypothetical protein